MSSNGGSIRELTSTASRRWAERDKRRRMRERRTRDMERKRWSEG